jgi:hypothetical protein
LVNRPLPSGSSFTSAAVRSATVTVIQTLTAAQASQDQLDTVLVATFESAASTLARSTGTNQEVANQLIAEALLSAIESTEIPVPAAVSNVVGPVNSPSA